MIVSANEEDFTMRNVACVIALLTALLLPRLGFSTADSIHIKTPSENVLGISAPDPNKIWIATSNGIISYDYKIGKTEYYSSPFDDWFVKEISFDSKNNLWIAAVNGVYKWQHESREFKSVLPDVSASSITTGEEDVVWVGTTGQGVIKIVDDNPETWFRTASGLPNDYVLDIISTEKGAVWAGTTEGLSLLEENTWTAVSKLEGLQVFSITGHNNQLAVGTDVGLYILDDQAGWANPENWREIEDTRGMVVTSTQILHNSIIAGTKDQKLFWLFPDGSSRFVSLNEAYPGSGFSGNVITSMVPGGGRLYVGSYGDGVTGISVESLGGFTAP